jgi:hypothetical protein
MLLIDFGKEINKIVCELLTNQGFASNLGVPINYFLTFDRARRTASAGVISPASPKAERD